MKKLIAKIPSWVLISTLLTLFGAISAIFTSSALDTAWETGRLEAPALILFIEAIPYEIMWIGVCYGPAHALRQFCRWLIH